MKKNNNINPQTLTTVQADTVREMIINSMASIYTDSGTMPSDAFYLASGKIADSIIKNVQYSLKNNVRLPVNFGKLKTMAKAKSPAKKAVKKVAKKKK